MIFTIFLTFVVECIYGIEYEQTGDIDFAEHI